MASPRKPTALLLQGTFQLPEAYDKFARLIESRGFPVVQPPYPSLIGQDQPHFTKKTLADDVQIVESAITKLIVDESKTILVVMHSYGGLVGAEAVPENLTLKSRKERSLHGGIAYFFFFSAFFMPMGQSIATAVGDSPDHDHWDGRFKMRDPLTTMYSDLPADQAAYWAARVIPQSNAVNDTAVPAPVQEMFAHLAGSIVKKIDSGHSAMLSNPEEVVALLEDVVL
ncbi:hypothetical protein K458DRAFT_454290 [Lentithecium fluviatile CBS 122367]|uniref:AB hydrolase-1 domain-containing protein n=1 Tax=Lentithecium fluviatile CBS 122367 TaxID=1168545 RepID=A0A6G1IWP2_9PLEO|nr:hypothetical protein K458DRAFT_454290 [Lentithecium fluviatile CBS 122367]